MATEKIKFYSGHKRRSLDKNDIVLEYNTIPIKRRRKTCAFHSYNKENDPSFDCNKIVSEIAPFRFIPTDSIHETTSESCNSSTSYTSFQSPYIKTGIQKLTEFWRRIMIGSSSAKSVSIQPQTPPKIETEAMKSPNSDNFDNDTHHFDFQALLKSLTADFEQERERAEFHYLAKQIAQLNINLSAQQMEEILQHEEEMKSMIDNMQQLNINVSDKQYNNEMVVILTRLSELTLNGDNDEFDHFDEDEEQNTLQTDIVQNNKNQTITNINRTVKKHKQKSISVVHKCAEFMLSMLMIGAPLLYYYVN